MLLCVSGHIRLGRTEHKMQGFCADFSMIQRLPPPMPWPSHANTDDSLFSTRNAECNDGSVAEQQLDLSTAPMVHYIGGSSGL